jgi:glycosyltransferase involved in cell wall biosynthesis
MLNTKPIISVIMPIYNGEKWLLTSLKSLVDQTFKNFEILLIDDGSVDNSAKICKSFLEKESRARYFHKENGGVSSARNLGLEKALGKYVYFFDCDDVLASDALEFLVNLQKDTGADIVSCACLEVQKHAVPSNLKVVENAKVIIATDDKWNYRYLFRGAIICKLFSRQVVGNTRFQEKVHYAEDNLFFTEVFIKATKVGYCSLIKAFYYIHRGSATHRVQPYSFFKGFVLAKRLIKEKTYAATDNVNIRAEVSRDYYISIFALFRYAVGVGDRKEYALLQEQYGKLLMDFLKAEKIPLGKKLEYKSYIKSYFIARLVHARKI